MTQRVYDNTVQVFFVATIANMAAPTVAEISAGTELTELLTKNGWQPNTNTNDVAADNLGSIVDGKIPGTYGFDCKLEMFRDDPTDAGWDLWVRGTTGFLVYVPYGSPGSAVTAGMQCSVFQGEMHQKSLANSAPNERQTFMAPFPVVDAELDATVAS